MIEYDSNGIYVDAKGNRSYKCYVEFRLDGKRTMGGVYVGQSTQDELLVDVHVCESSMQMGTKATEVWKSTGRLVTVRPPDVINMFTPDSSFAAPMPSDVDGLARLILDPDSSAPLYVALREEITRMAAQPPPDEKGYRWQPSVVTLVRSMPQARVLMEDKLPYDQLCTACKVLDRAAELIRGAA